MENYGQDRCEIRKFTAQKLRFFSPQDRSSTQILQKETNGALRKEK